MLSILDIFCAISFPIALVITFTWHKQSDTASVQKRIVNKKIKDIHSRKMVRKHSARIFSTNSLTDIGKRKKKFGLEILSLHFNTLLLESMGPSFHDDKKSQIILCTFLHEINPKLTRFNKDVNNLMEKFYGINLDQTLN